MSKQLIIYALCSIFIYCVTENTTASTVIVSNSTASTTTDTTTTDTTTTDTTTTDTTTDTTTTDTTTTDTTTTDTTTTDTTTTDTTTTTPTTTTTTPTTTTTTPTTTTTRPPHKLSSTFIWTNTDIQDQPDIVVEADDGYWISVNVSGVSLPYGGYLLLEGGTKHVSGATDGRVFANIVKGPYLYLFKRNFVYGYCSVKDNVTFKMEFKKVGAPTTTTSTTTTTEFPWPTTSKGDSAYITVNVSGTNVNKYSENKTIDAFKQCVVKMATTYCSAQNVTLLEDITKDNVLISNIIRCPYSWPESEKCVRITFRIPIFHDYKKWEGYQMDTKHLELMWLRYSSGKCFKDNNFSPYSEPDFDKSITWWAVGISVVIALFIILLWFLKTFSSQLKSTFRRRIRRNSDETSIISSKKDSLISLAPHYLQDRMDTPKFFET